MKTAIAAIPAAAKATKNPRLSTESLRLSRRLKSSILKDASPVSSRLVSRLTCSVSTLNAVSKLVCYCRNKSAIDSSDLAADSFCVNRAAARADAFAFDN